MARYGLTMEQYERLHSGARCDACGATDPGSKLGWHTDHDHACCPISDKKHACGQCVRGLLCFRCNSIAGWVENNPDRLESIVDYLLRNPRFS